MKEVGRAAVFGIQGQDHKRTDQAHDLGCLGSCFEALYGLLPDYVTSWLKTPLKTSELISFRQPSRIDSDHFPIPLAP